MIFSLSSLSSVSYASNKKKAHKASTDSAPLVTDDSCLKKELIIGVNAFTRCLERGHMRCGIVCLSAKPALLTGHILMLAATRNCPVMGLYDLSSRLAPALGIKSVLALGFKVSFIIDSCHIVYTLVNRTLKFLFYGNATKEIPNQIICLASLTKWHHCLFYYRN